MIKSYCYCVKKKKKTCKKYTWETLKKLANVKHLQVDWVNGGVFCVLLCVWNTMRTLLDSLFAGEKYCVYVLRRYFSAYEINRPYAESCRSLIYKFHTLCQWVPVTSVILLFDIWGQVSSQVIVKLLELPSWQINLLAA